MGRKRLLTMLATLVAAVGLQAAPAAAQTLDLPGVSVDVEDGLEVELEAQVTDDLELDPKVEADLDDEEGPSVDVDGGVKAGDLEVDLGEATEAPVDPEPEPTPSDPPPIGGSDDAEDEDDAAAADDASSAEQDRRGHKVGTSGGMASWTPERQARFEAFRAMRNYDFAFGSARSSSVLPGVELAPRRTDAGDDEVGALVYEQPQVAPGVAAAAPEPSGTHATLATAPVGDPTQQVPLPLQALTGMLIAGTALAWHLTRRELGWALSGLRKPS